MSDDNKNITGSGKTAGKFGADPGSRDAAAFGDAGFGAAKLGDALAQCLERLPEVDVPASFAARVTRLALAQPPVHASVWAGFGPRIALGSGVLLLILLFVFAAHSTPSFLNLRFDVELLLLVELGAVGFLVPRLGSRE